MQITGKHSKIIYFVAGLLAFAYVLIRAVTVGITYDEVWTLNNFVPRSVIDIISYRPCDANNHLVNTLLIKALFVFGDHSLFIARLPNVLSFILYLYFAYKITSKYLSPFPGIGCFLLLMLNPFLLDFFSLVRGYGLALAFQMVSVYFLVTFFKEHKTRNALWALVLGAVAVLCNFPWLNYWVAVLFLINVVPLFYRKQFERKKIMVFSILISAALALIIYLPIKNLLATDSLYYGGNTGFYHDTLISLVKYSFYDPAVHPAVLISLNIFMSLVVLSVVVSFYFDRDPLSVKNILLFVLILCIASVVTQHHLFGTLYLIDRTALFFYPLFIFSACFSLNEFSKKWVSKALILTCIVSFSLNFFAHANFYKTAVWYFDARTTSILKWLNDKGREENRKFKIDYSWPFQSSFVYYSEKDDYPNVEIVKNIYDKEELNPDADYYIFLDRSLEKNGYDAERQKINLCKKDTVRKFGMEGIIIFALTKE
jgi:hypothetical protein